MKNHRTRPRNVIAQLGIDTIDTINIQSPNIYKPNQTNGKKNLFHLLTVSADPPVHIMDKIDKIDKMEKLPELKEMKKQENTTASYDKLIVFTDGACSSNGTVRARAGYGVVWPNQRSLDVSKRLNGSEQTNNRAEFMALIEAQHIADTVDPSQQKPLYVYTDSELLVNSITKWLAGWKKNGWKKSNKKSVLNQDLLQQIDSNPRPLIFKHVRAHTGRKDWESIYNEEADRLAREGLYK